MGERITLPVNQLELERVGGSVKLEAVLIAGGATGLKITSPEVPTADATVAATHKMKININGTEYYLPLESV